MEVNRLLKQYDMMLQLVKQMSGNSRKMKKFAKMGGMPGMPGMGGFPGCETVMTAQGGMTYKKNQTEVKINGQDQTSQDGR